ncbi:hypothetical protein AAFF_G00205350 [Aldrovandia affinis]|uniref:Uncharacterized protein n=1 Tax=Aldrovandia affinis TaxID=143900 RepID=A0AAD7W5E3_9TELE|nr:hypothetical protein AAFF_G00205350 [Aldrovandia affinis]
MSPGIFASRNQHVISARRTAGCPQGPPSFILFHAPPTSSDEAQRTPPREEVGGTDRQLHDLEIQITCRLMPERGATHLREKRRPLFGPDLREALPELQSTREP